MTATLRKPDRWLLSFSGQRLHRPRWITDRPVAVCDPGLPLSVLRTNDYDIDRLALDLALPRCRRCETTPP